MALPRKLQIWTCTAGDAYQQWTATAGTINVRGLRSVWMIQMGHLPMAIRYVVSFGLLAGSLLIDNRSKYGHATVDITIS